MNATRKITPESVLVILPTFNEAQTIVQMLQRIRLNAPGIHVLVVDDSSPDGTAQIVTSYITEKQANGEVMLLLREEKKGLGKAYLAGFEYAFEHGYEYVVSMDADGSHQPEELPHFFEAVAQQNASLVLGSRWMNGGNVMNWSARRQMLSKAGTKYAQICLGTHVRDITGGYRLYRAEMLKQLLERPVESKGYAFQIELAWRAEKQGYKVVEIPILFTERTEGHSKMSASIVLEAIFKVAFWGLAR